MRLPNKRHGLANSGVPSPKNIFSGPCRNRGCRAVIAVRGPHPLPRVGHSRCASYGRYLRHIKVFLQPPEFPDIEADPDEGGLGLADAVNISRGVIITAERKFQPDDDVWKLLRMLAKVPWVLDGSDGSRWPVGRLVTNSQRGVFSAVMGPTIGSRTQTTSAELGSTTDAPEWPRRCRSRGCFCARRQQVRQRMQLAEERTELDRRMRRDVISNCRGRELAAVSA